MNVNSAREIYKAPMSRFFFHFSDGTRTFTDTTGIELAGIAAIRKHARAQIRDMVSVITERNFQDWAGWKMIVLDAFGKTILEVSFDLSPRLSN